MTHLSPAEFVDAVEGQLPKGRTAHLEGCAQCHAAVADVREAWTAAGASDVPEPSPMYWQHFAARVRERVEEETIVPAWRATPWREYLTVRNLVPMASAVALVAAVAGAGLLSRHVAVPPAGERAAVVGTVPAILAIEPEDSEAWEVLTSAAADVPIEDAHDAGMGVPAGAVDRAVQRMTPDELNELGRLLRSELRRSGD